MNGGQDEVDISSVEHFLGYFDSQVLASYRNEPDKYVIRSDFFEGKLTVTDEYYRSLEKTGETDQTVYVHFGYRTLNDGSLAIVAWLPDLCEKSKAHAARWSAFELRSPEWTAEYDERFDNWIRRNLEGSWDVDSGPSYYLAETIKIINGLTNELVGLSLYKHELDDTLPYPAAENTHAYQDSHKNLYGYLIDGLDKQCISQLGARLGSDIKADSDRTVQSLKRLFPSLGISTDFKRAMDLVSQQRRLASHGVRDQAKEFGAFSAFTQDLQLCLRGVKEVLGELEAKSGMDGQKAYDRHTAKQWLPCIAHPPESHYSIVQALRMQDKTVERVEVGTREELDGVHQSEVIIVHFTDGSIMSLVAGSNVANLVSDEHGLRPKDLNVSFIVHWVPGLPTAVSNGD